MKDGGRQNMCHGVVRDLGMLVMGLGSNCEDLYIPCQGFIFYVMELPLEAKRKL